MSREVEPRWKTKTTKKRRKVGRADPDRPLATWCELRDVFPDKCGQRATERHHKERGPRRRHNGPTMDLCWHCHHVEIHGNPTRAYERGWLIRSGR